MANAIAKVDPRTELRTMLEGDKMRAALRAVLPKHLTPERMVKVALTATMKNPVLLQCTRDSLLRAIMDAAELGLEPGGALGHAYLVPYYNSKERRYECQMQPGYRGLIALARRSGEIASIEAHPVYANDKYTVRFGLNPALEHEPVLEGEPGELKFVYAIARLTTGGTQVEVMTRAQVEHVRAKSQTGRSNSGPWHNDYDEMARKSVVKRLFKYLPVSTELARALDLDARAEHGEADVDISGIAELLPGGEEQTTPAPATRADELKAHLDAMAPPANATTERDQGDDDGDDEPPPTGTDAPARGVAHETASATAPGAAKVAKPAAGAKALSEREWRAKCDALQHREHALNTWRKYGALWAPEPRAAAAQVLARAMVRRSFAAHTDAALEMLGELAPLRQAV